MGQPFIYLKKKLKSKQIIRVWHKVKALVLATMTHQNMEDEYSRLIGGGGAVSIYEAFWVFS